MMEHQKLLAALKQLKVQTGGLACMGCGYEHDCGIHGCAIIREAVAYIVNLETTHRTEMCEAGYDCTELGKVRKSLQAAESKLDEAKRYDWISVEERLPIEHDSIFKKLIDNEKWRAGMFKTLSDDVIVAAKFADGTRKTGVTHTKEGIWTGLPSIGCPIVTHWMPMPKPPEQEE